MTRRRYGALGEIEDSQLQAVLDRFDLGTLTASEPLTNGLFGKNIALTTNKGSWVLRGNPGPAGGDDSFRRARFFASTIRSTCEVPATGHEDGGGGDPYVDLGLDYRFGSAGRAALIHLFEALEARRRRGGLDASLVATDAVSAGTGVPVVRGSLADLVAWLAGRGSSGLVVDGGTLPGLPPLG